MIETAVSVFSDLWVIEPFRWLVVLIAATSVMAWIAGHVERVTDNEDPPKYIRLVEFPVYFATTILSVLLNLTLGWIWGPPTKDTLTFTKRLEDVLSHPEQYKWWQVRVAKWGAWWVNKLWMGHIENA